ncbi:hypothetical protein [Streptomyces sp. TRM75561]|uniref:hypothetical protein n=1 Tax=Streptomyces sp. TRM75561 TaxID=2975269 RepID=UPI002447CB8C|nr:hypothetical protein [Streptomyces sp. TRM75561]MDH3039034.1 hypothetical protein [Streptomyces sp. TRM75561]
MRDIIVTHGDLIIEDEMPQAVLEFCAHAASYESLLSDWEANGSAERVLIRHPGQEFSNYVRESYRRLKNAQADALRRQR